jgi:glutamine cyclotransferase
MDYQNGSVGISLLLAAVIIAAAMYSQKYAEAKNYKAHPASYSSFLSNLIRSDSREPSLYSYRVINIYPHDPQASTQGLIFDKGFLYESTGIRGKSTLRKVQLHTGKVLKTRLLPPHYFAEGLTLLQEKLFQITWKSSIGFVYHQKDFQKIMEFRYDPEGWGLTQNGRFLIMSDGTATLRFLDPDTFVEVKQLEVVGHGSPIRYLNELEYIEGEIYANIWQTDYIARISPQTGQVTGWIDLAGLSNTWSSVRQTGVLNGIAYDSAEKRMFVTGKLWPKLFEIELIGTKK